VAFFRPLYYDWPQEAALTIARRIPVWRSDAGRTNNRACRQGQRPGHRKVWLPTGEWIEWPTGKHFTGPAAIERSFSIEQMPVYLRAGAIVPMQPPMRFTGEKPVDPLIVNVWPLTPGTTSSYSVYEDSGVAVEYQRGVFARTPIKAAQTGDKLRVEIGPSSAVIGNAAEARI